MYSDGLLSFRITAFFNGPEAKVFGVSISVFFPDMAISEKQHALMSATGDLAEKDLNELIEYAKFRKARTILDHAKRPRKKTSDSQ